MKKIFNFAAQNGMTSLDFQNKVIMNLEKLVAVAGISGVFRLVANRNNGLIIEDLDTGKRSFASSRKHQFTPLETIGIFIDNGETEELKVIFQKIIVLFQEIYMFDIFIMLRIQFTIVPYPYSFLFPFFALP